MKSVIYIVILLFAATLAGFAVWVRLAPSDPAIWNVSVADATVPTAGPCVDQVKEVPKGARATCLMSDDPARVLTKLNMIALAADRTQVLAGTPADGRITWISRSKVVGFPDYVTAEATTTPEGTRLDILSRLRFGESDLGVNPARLRSWLQGL